MIESSIIFIEILQRPKKKNIIFKKIIIPRSISIFIFTFIVILVLIGAIKTTKTMKPVRQKLINEIRAKTDLYRIILRILDQLFSIIIKKFLANSTDLQRVIWKNYLEGNKNNEEIVVIIAANIITDINYIR